MSNIENKEVSDVEKTFANAVQEWLGNYKDAVFGVTGAMAGAQMEHAAQEIKKYMYGGTNTSTLLGLYRQGQASNKICLLKTGSTILTKGLTGFAISDAFITDVKNGTPDQTLKTSASLTLAYGIGGLVTSIVGTGVAAAATVALLGAGIYIYIDNNWDGIKREGLSYIWNDYINGVSNIIYNAMVTLDDDAKLLMNEQFEKIQSYLAQNNPESIDALYNDMLTNQSNQLDILGQLLGENFCPLKNNPITDIVKLKETAEVTPSPLIVDLDGDGVETTGVQSGTHFDHDGNGFAENTGWVGKDDGILVRDINGNGEIDNGTELFGNNSVLSNGEKAANGFEALKDLDSNNDGIFNNNELLTLLYNNPLSYIGRNNALWA